MTTSEPCVISAEADSDLAIEVSFEPEQVLRQWEELEEQGTAFQTRAWLLAWYRVIGAKFAAVPLFVTVRERGSGRPLMFFPLCLRRHRGLTTIEFADLGVSDYNAPLVAPEVALNDAQMHALFDAIRRCLPPADLIRFEKIPEMVCGRANPLARLDWLQRMELRSWALALPQRREDFDDCVLKRKDRKELRRKRRNLSERLGELMLVNAVSASERRAIFEILRAERQRRFAQCKRSDILCDPTFFRFYESVVLESEGGFAALSALEAAGQVAATLFALRHNGRYLLIMHSFEELEGLSPGIVAIDEMITHLIETGITHCDFTIGNEPYKHQFGVEEGFLYNGLYPLTTKGRLFVNSRQVLRRVKHRLTPLFARRPAPR